MKRELPKKCFIATRDLRVVKEFSIYATKLDGTVVNVYYGPSQDYRWGKDISGKSVASQSST
jgi:hypothetical protein